MGEVEAELHGLREDGGALEDLVDGGAHLEEGVGGHDHVRGEDEPACTYVRLLPWSTSLR